MAKKTKKKGHRKQAGPPQAVQDELLALEAIYGDAEGGVGACHRDEDDNGFQLRVVPYPAGGGQNNTWCDIHVRCVISSHTELALLTCLSCRLTCSHSMQT